MNISPLNSGMQAIQQAQSRMTDAASRIAGSAVNSDQSGQPKETTDMAKNLIELRQAEIQARAGAKVVKSENERVGRLIDEMV